MCSVAVIMISVVRRLLKTWEILRLSSLELLESLRKCTFDLKSTWNWRKKVHFLICIMQTVFVCSRAVLHLWKVRVVESCSCDMNTHQNIKGQGEYGEVPFAGNWGQSTGDHWAAKKNRKQEMDYWLGGKAKYSTHRPRLDRLCSP